MKKSILFSMSLVLMFSVACKPKKSAKTPMRPKAGATPSVSAKTKGCVKHAGLFTIYEDTSTGKAYMQISKEQLGKEFIYFAYTENGVLQAGHHRGSYRDNQIFKIRKRFDRIEFIKENTNFYFDPENALSKSKNANISNSVLVSEPILASTKDSIYLLSADDIFISEDLTQVTPPSIPGLSSPFSFRLGRLNTKKSGYQKIRNYPSNTDLVVEYVFDNPGAFVSGGSEVADPRSVNIQLQHSFIEVPDNDFVPRKDDPRVGFFMDQMNDMTSYSATPYKDVIHRWNLVKKDPNAALSEPVTPITWWIENTTPVEYRETIREAGLAWNQAFEKAGFKNAIEIKIQPDTAEWDAGDIRYNVLRWTSSPRPPFGGYGPSFVNPRTGEILGADIMLEFVFLTNRINQFKLFTTAGLELPEWENAIEPNADGMHQCNVGELLHHNTMLGMSNLMVNEADAKSQDEFIKSAVYYLILHEMGHTLGLMHNMKASNLWMPEEIHDKTKTSKLGLIGSVMDYPAININPDHSKQGDYYTTKPGPYDMWAIEYAYSAGLKDAAQEDARLEKILARSTEKELRFGNDADDMRAPGKGTDPRVMIFDISGDAVNYSASRIGMLNETMSKLKSTYSNDGEGYQGLVNAYLTLTGEMGNASSVISRYIGGVYVERSMVGQAGAQIPYTPIPEDYQKTAMKHLSNLVFSPEAFKAPEGLYNFLQAQRRGFNFFSVSEDPKIHERVLRIQKNVLLHVLHENTLDRVTNSSLYGNTYSVAEIMNDLEKAIFDADLSGSTNTFRVNLQSYYVNTLIYIAGLKGKSSYNQVSKSAAYSSLLSIQKKMKANQGRGDATTQAHRKFVEFTITKAFES